MSTTNRPPHVRRHAVAAAGTALTLAGIGGIGRALILDGDHRKPYLLQISTTSLLAGVVMIGQSILSKRPLADDQEYLLGHDVGYAKGKYDERERTRPTLVEKVWRRSPEREEGGQ